MIKKIVLSGLAISLLMFGFGDSYSLMPKITTQLGKIQTHASNLERILEVPEIIFQSDSLTIELTIAQKKKLFDEAVAEWLKLKTSYDSLKILIQQFDKDSLNGG